MENQRGSIDRARQNRAATDRTNGPNEQKFSIDTVTGEKDTYPECVILDTDIFNGVKPRNWGRILGKFVYENLAGTELTMYDESGNEETVNIAKTTDRVRKDGAKNGHKVIDKLARFTGDNTKALATIHLSELLATSKNVTSTNEHSHQWMDKTDGYIVMR